MAVPTYVNAGAAEAATITIPVGHQAGDALVMFAFRDGSTTSPSLPTGWIAPTGGVNSGTLCSSRVAWKYAGSSSETSGTWTNATELVCYVVRGVATNKVPLYIPGAQTGTGTSVAFGGVAPMQCPGTSILIGFIGHSSTDTSIATSPAGMTNRASISGATAQAAVHDTGVLSSWTLANVALGGTSGNWIEKTVEILAEQTNLQNYMGIDAASGMSVGEKIR